MVTLSRFSYLLCGVTITINAALLFIAQPMMSKMLLPLVGGAPAVWTTSVLYYQVILLVGYAYVRLLSHLALRSQFFIHIVLLFVALKQPFAVRSASIAAESALALWTIITLTISLGAPLVVLSAGAPLLQVWVTAFRRWTDAQTYALYSTSNLGSIIALSLYPFVIEPSVGVQVQRTMWQRGFGVLVVLYIACAVVLGRGQQPTRVSASNRAVETRPAPSNREKGRCVFLSFTGALLLYGISTLITTDIAAVPLLWVVPLSLYLLSYAIAFAPFARRLGNSLTALQVTALVGWLALSILPDVPLMAVLGWHLAVFFVLCVVCHCALADSAPSDPAHLASYYTRIALGGVLAGMFAVLIAPSLFDTPIEYTLAIVLTCFHHFGRRPLPTSAWNAAREALIALALGGFILLLLRWGDTPTAAKTRTSFVFIISAFLWLRWQKHPARLAFTVCAWLAMSPRKGELGHQIYASRNFFGVHSVNRQNDKHYLYSGSTVHGAQDRRVGLRSVPLTYFHRGGPFGVLFERLFEASPRPLNVAVVGLGAGTLACYGRPDDSWTFVEIDPEVVRIAQDTSFFSYLRDCLPQVRIMLGDGRKSLESWTGSKVDLLVVDAFSSDAIPVHLLTREGFRALQGVVNDSGVIALHISNRYLDLAPVIAAAAEEERIAAYESSVMASAARGEAVSMSKWVSTCRVAATCARLAGPMWTPLENRRATRPWSDDWSDLWGSFKWNQKERGSGQ